MATPKRKKPRKYGHGTITRLPNGKASAYISIAGVVNRRRFPSEPEAEAWLDAHAAHLSCELTATQIQDAAAARAILPPNVSLLQLAQAWLDAQERTNAPAPIAPLIEEYLAERAAVLRPDTIRTYRPWLAAALADIGPNLSDYTSETVRRGLAHHTPHQHNHILRALRTFFNWCIDRGDAAVNPCDGVKQKKLNEPSRAILTLAQTEQLLYSVHATRPHLLGYFVLCLFAGLRPTESRRIPASCIGREYIHLPAGIVKTAQARTVPVEAGLLEVLERYPLDRRAYAGIRKARRASGLLLAPDIMRHSYASYAYERSRSAAGTAYDMGHRGTDVFFRHYRGLVAPGEGQKYFEILANFAIFLQQSK